MITIITIIKIFGTLKSLKFLKSLSLNFKDLNILIWFFNIIKYIYIYIYKKTVQVPYITGISWLAKTYYLRSNNSIHRGRHMDTEKQTVMANHKQHTYQMWLTTDTQTVRWSFHTLTLFVIVFNLTGRYQAFKAAYYRRLHRKVTANTTQRTARMQMPRYSLHYC